MRGIVNEGRKEGVGGARRGALSCRRKSAAWFISNRSGQLSQSMQVYDDKVDGLRKVEKVRKDECMDKWAACTSKLFNASDCEFSFALATEDGRIDDNEFVRNYTSGHCTATEEMVYVMPF